MWTGRTDSERKERFHQFVESVPIEEIPSVDTTAVSFVGFASDEGVRRNQGRPGACEGPQAIRDALASLPYFNQGVKLFDIGDIECSDGNLEASQAKLAEKVGLLQSKKILPIVLGGGHEVAWGHYQGIIKEHRPETITIVNFDAHLDMRPYTGQSTSGTPFRQIASYLDDQSKPFHYMCIGLQPSGNTPSLLDTAKAYEVDTVLAEQIHMTGIESTFHKLEALVESNRKIYVTVCMDVFASPFAPGVSAPQPLGLTPWQVIPLLRYLANSGNVISLDFAELAPNYDLNSVTAKLAASLIFDFIHHFKI